MAKERATFSKLAQMRHEERVRSAQRDPGLLQGLSPTELAMLFPDYFKRGEPDVGGFRAAISKTTAEKQAALMESIGQRVGVDSKTGQAYPGSAGFGKVNNPVKAKEIYDYIRSKGIDHVHALGIVNNINHESSFNSGSEHWDVNGPSGGLFQHHDVMGKGGRYTKMTSFVGADWKTNWKGQIDYALTEGEMKSYLATSYGDAAAASVGFTKQFENPANANSVAFDRLKTLGTLEKLSQEGGTTNTAGSKNTDGTPKQTTGATTPGQAAGDTTNQAGQKSSGAAFNVVSGYIVPKDNSLYDTRNSQQCATLGKAFNPNIGRSSGWTIVDGDIKAGQVVATKQYNNAGPDKVGAGYHTGVALTAPNEKGDFLLLEQYNNSGGAKTRWVNKNSYPVGNTGQTTSWGLISSGGKVHDEISQEALQYGQSLGTPAQNASIGSNSGSPGAGGEAAPGVAGNVSQGPMGGGTFGQGDQQSATLMQPMGMVQNLMGMMQGGPMGMMGMMGGFGGMGMQSATPLGLITTAMGFIMPLIGSIAGERLSGEGMGDGPTLRSRHRGHIKIHHGMRHANAYRQSQSQSQARAAARQTTKSVDAAPAGPVTIGDPSRAQKFLSLISKGEGGYNSMNQGTVGKRIVGSTHDSTKVVGKKLTELSIGEIMDMQKGSLKTGRKLFAVGKYQIIPETMKKVVAMAGLSRDQKFDEATQEKLGMALIQKRGKLHDYLTGKSNDEHGAMVEAAREWASLPHPKTGRSIYGGGNKSSHSVESVRTALRDTRKDMMAAPTQFAGGPGTTNVSAMPTTGAVGQTPTTPTTAGLTTPTQLAKEPSLAEKLRIAVGGAPQSTAAEAKPASPITPSVGATPTTPSTTNKVTADISSAAAPAKPISREVRNPLGVYSTPSTKDIMYQFGGGGKTKMTADITPQNNVPATPAAPVSVTASPGAMPAPGPAPDTTSLQMNQVRNEMQAIAATNTNTSNAPQSTKQVSESASKGVNLDSSMKQISQPYNTPSFHRAITRAFGNETPGEVGQSHFDYGNAR